MRRRQRQLELGNTPGDFVGVARHNFADDAATVS
jgi:hypothetical protein